MNRAAAGGPARHHFPYPFVPDQPAGVTRQDIQAYVAHLANAGYASKTIDHIHDVLSAILRTAVKWGHLSDNPARGVDLPKLRTVRPKWVLTPCQATTLLDALPPLARTMAGMALLSGLRRGELFALRWRHLDDAAQCLDISEAVYEGVFGTPKTEAGVRQIPLSEAGFKLLTEWKEHAKNTERDALMFSTRSGKTISPNNVLRRWIFPACAAQGLPHATWLTFRRTYSSWSHDKGVPGSLHACPSRIALQGPTSWVCGTGSLSFPVARAGQEDRSDSGYDLLAVRLAFSSSKGWASECSVS